MKNIFIIGPVASGKNSLMTKIIENNEVIALDTGQIYRYVALKIYNEIKDKIDIKKILLKDEKEIEKTSKLIFHLKNYCSEKLKELSFDSNNLYENENILNSDDLYIKEVNALLPIVAKISTIRTIINNFISNNVVTTDKPIIMTGHNIKEIDTTQFLVVYLDVNSTLASYRLFNRNRDSYEDITEAYNEVNKRNSTDKIELTKKIMPYLYEMIYIDTNDKSINEIYQEFIKKSKEFDNKEEQFKNIQEKSIERNDFEWILNVALQPIKEVLDEITNNIIKKYPYVNKNDLIYQTMITLTSLDLQDIYNCDDEFAIYLQQSIKNRDEASIKIVKRKIKNKEININIDLVAKVLKDSTNKLLELYKDPEVQEIMKFYNEIQEKTVLKNKNGSIFRINNKQNTEDKITFKVIDSETSSFISKYCHYLHTPRTDELVAYGAFVNNEKYPIAYVSFSKHDREYKKELLYNLGIEPQNTIEMTRAWCSNSAPANIMSSLFQYSIDEITKDWKEKSQEGIEDKYLQAITTTINPNLGFKASSFLGCNFIPIALRPAKFTFINNNGIIEYKTRRNIKSEDEYFENKIEILPLNELILCTDKNKERDINNSNILLINKKDYESVLKNDVKKKVKA